MEVSLVKRWTEEMLADAGVRSDESIVQVRPLYRLSGSEGVFNVLVTVDPSASLNDRLRVMIEGDLERRVGAIVGGSAKIHLYTRQQPLRQLRRRSPVMPDPWEDTVPAGL
jgi:hypothetical protein